MSESSPFTIPATLTSFDPFTAGRSFKDMRFYGFSQSDFLKNIAFFVPYGALFSAIIRKRYAVGYVATLLIVIMVGGLLSCVIEGLQLFLQTRSTGMTDIVGNMLGSGLGMPLTLMIQVSGKLHPIS